MSCASRTAAVAGLVAAITVGVGGPASAAPATTPSSAPLEHVIVQELPEAGNGPERAVTALGGALGQQLGLIHGFSATLPADRLAALRATPGVRAVTPDAAVRLASSDVTSQTSQTGSLDSLTKLMGATALWGRGVTGRGVDVALIDSGVVPVDGLRTAGKVVHGPDLSLEAQQCDATGSRCTASPAEHLDGFGHGTAMAGIIAGRDDAAPAAVSAKAGETDFLGVAPDARIVSVKVADAGGASDVSQVIAGIDWVVRNKDANGLHVRVLNLAFGTDSVQDYRIDPLAYAAEAAWRAGVVVVVSAGNTGAANGRLADPAVDPYVLAVGAVDDQGTRKSGDDVIPSWSSEGDGVRNPDLVAPGAGVVGLRDPGSFLDTHYPDARVGTRFFRGSGTSQAAAVVSGAAALLLSARPELTNDQVKALLTGSAKHVPSAGKRGQGHGLMDVRSALAAHVPTPAAAAQSWPAATGTGSLEAARGTTHVVVGGSTLTGEVDVTGAAWAGPSAASGAAWSGHWNADHYAGQRWSSAGWVSAPWVPDASGAFAARMWAGDTWTARMWAANGWDASMWAARMWAASMWA